MKRELGVDHVFDIETQDWDRFTLGGVIHADQSYESFRHNREDAFVDHLLALQGNIWTWNGGLFDSLWLSQHLRKRGIRATATTAGTKIICLDVGSLSIRDGSALYPTSLKKAAKAFGVELSKETGLECRCGKKCGGYCSIRIDMPESDYAKLDHYLRLDCIGTFRAVDGMLSEAKRIGLEIASTIGSMAYKTAARICDIEPAEWFWPNYRFARSAYYGGRVEVFCPRSDVGFAYDIHSAYPAALSRIDLPTGDLMVLRGERAGSAYRRERPGAYMARVEVPLDMHVPPLPVRTPKGRVVFPVGPVQGVWSLLELRAAEDSGCSVRVDRAMVWSDSEPVLAPFVEMLWRERAAAMESNPEKAGWLKYGLNSPTGKFAQDPERERVVINPDPEEIKVCECGPKSGKCRCDAWRPLDLDGEVWAAPFWRIPECGHVQWAMYLTSATRVQLRDQLVADGEDGRTALYCDTDSVIARTEREHDIGDDLGQWGFEGRLESGIDEDTGQLIPAWQALAPKVYRSRGADGTVKVRGKGLPGLDSEGFDRFERGEKVVNQRGVMGFKSAVRGGSAFRRKNLRRQSHADGRHFGGRVLGRDGLTHPQSIREILAWERQGRR